MLLQRSTSSIAAVGWDSAQLTGEKSGSHGGETMAATWYLLHFARETEHIEGRNYACALKLRCYKGHVSTFWTAGFHIFFLECGRCRTNGSVLTCE